MNQHVSFLTAQEKQAQKQNNNNKTKQVPHKKTNKQNKTKLQL